MEKTPPPNPIKSFKLLNGQEIIAEVVGTKQNLGSDAVTAYLIKRPQSIYYAPNPDPRLPGKLVIMAWTLSNPAVESVELPASMVVVAFDPSAMSEKKYLEEISGLDLQSRAPVGRISE